MFTTAPLSRDDWVLVGVSLALPLALGVAMSLEASILLLIAFVYLCAAFPITIFQTVFGVVDLVRRRWRAVLTRVAIILAVASFLPLLKVGEKAGYFGRLVINYTDYERQVAGVKRPGQPVFRLWEWNGYLIFNTMSLAYDESDGLRADRSRRSRDWWRRAADASGGLLAPDADFDADHFFGHYYLVTTF